TGWQCPFHFLNERLNIELGRAVSFAPEFMNERAHEPRRGGVQRRNKVSTALRAVDAFFYALEHLLNLLVELCAVRDDEHPRILPFLPSPSRKPHHREALARALSVPDDAAFSSPHMFPRRPYTEILIVAADLLRSCVENDEIVNQLQEAILLAKLQQGA